MELVDNRLDALLKKGFTRRMALAYQGLLLHEDTNPMYDPEYRSWAHAHGFQAETACGLQVNEGNIDDYLPDYTYYRVWPLNDWQRMWVNDKLTLKYVLTGTEFGSYMPDYYFYFDRNKGLEALVDAHAPATMDGFLGVLREQGEIATKPANGGNGAGFDKLAYQDGAYLLNNKEVSEAEICEFVETHPNNIYTEFFRAGGLLGKISPVIHTVRVQTINPTGSEPHLAAAYVRFASGHNSDDSVANFRAPLLVDNIAMYNTQLNTETGAFGNGKLIYANRVLDMPNHPDTGVPAEGVIAEWPEIRRTAMALAEHLNLVEYMGFDFCVTPKGVKLIEINTHSGGKYLQVFTPYLKDPFLREYFLGKIAAIEALDDAGIARRNAIAH